MSKKSNKSSKKNLKRGATFKPSSQSSNRKVVKTINTPSRTTDQKPKRVNPQSRKENTPVELPFGKMNYILLFVGVAVIALGFFLMSLDDFVDATQFSISLYIAPIVVVAGFLEIIYAIMYTPKKE